MGMLVIVPGVCQVFSPGHHRATEIRCWDCNNHGSEPFVGTMEKLRLWPGQTSIYMCSQSLQLLKLDLFWLWENLLSVQLFCWCCVYKTSWGVSICNFWATRRYFSCFSLVSWLLSLNYGFSPTSAFQHLVLIYTSRLFSGMAQRAVKDHLCRSQSHSVLPATDQLLCSLIVHEAPLLSQLIPLLVRGLLWIRGAFLSFSSPPEFRSHPAFAPLPLPFALSSYSVIWESFFVLLGVQSPC